MPYYERVEKLRRRLSIFSKKAAYLVKKQENIRYLTGFTGSSGFVLITAEDTFLYSDSRYQTQAKEESKITEFVLVHGKPWSDLVKQKMRELAYETLVFDKKELTVQDSEALFNPFFSLESRLDWVEDLRQIKDPEEVERIAEAQKLAEEALEASLGAFKAGHRERDVALELEWEMRKRGASALSFPTILASGVRAAMPHGQASDKLLEEGDLVVLDFGCVLDGYCSDMTRTFAIGFVGQWERRLYETVLTAQKMALDRIKAGVSGAEMQALVQNYFNQEGYGEYFGHGLGHSIGLEVHEKPSLSPLYTRGTPAGAVMSVEPGLYVPGRAGVRIEDLIVVTETGHENLNRFPKELMFLGTRL